MDRPEQPPGLTLGMGLMLWVAVIAAVAGFVAIGAVLKFAPLYAGFLFVWFWSSVDGVAFARVPATLTGGAAGVATAWLLQYAAATYGPAGALWVLALILIALLVQIMNWLPMVINSAYMLFLTVTAAPVIQLHEDFRQIAISLLVGAAYFGAVVAIGRRVFAMLSRAPAVVDPPVAVD